MVVFGWVTETSILACFMYPAAICIFRAGKPHYAVYVLSAFFAGALTLFQHRANLVRLMQKKENRLDFKKISDISRKINSQMHDKSAHK